MNADTNATPPGDGWNRWLDFWRQRPWEQSPYHVLAQGSRVEIWRPEWGNETSFAREPLHPAMNVAGLWWRLA